MSKTIELVRQEVETIKNEVEDFANSASRIGEAMSDILEYNKELTETEANRAKDVEQSLSEEINNIKEAISNIGGEGGEGSKEVTRAEFELVKVESKSTFNAFSELGMTEKADADGYEIALAKATNTAEKTKVKVPVFDAQNMAKNPAGLVNEVFVEDMASMMNNKINDALEDFTPPEGGGSNVTIVQETGESTTDVMSQKAVTDAIAAEKKRAEDAEKELSEKLGDWIPNDYGNTITENLNTINKALEDSVPDEVPTEGSTSTVTSGGVYQAIVTEKQKIDNLTDGIDIAKEDGILRLANRDAMAREDGDEVVVDSLGYVILRTGTSIVDQVSAYENPMIFEVRDLFDLGGEEISFAAGSIIKFCGGQIANGTISGENITLEGKVKVDKVAGKWDVFKSSWSSMAAGYDKLAMLLAIDAKELVLDESFIIDSNGGKITTSIPVIKGAGCTIDVQMDLNYHLIQCSNASEVSGLTFNHNGHKGVGGIFINSYDGYIHDIEVTGIRDADSASGVTAVRVAIESGDCRIERIKANDLTCVANKLLGDSNGSVVGLMVGNKVKDNSVIINEVNFQDIYNVNQAGTGQKYVFEDGAGLYYSQSSIVDSVASIVVRNVYGKNYGKRLIKTDATNLLIEKVTAIQEYKGLGLTVIGINNQDVDEVKNAKLYNVTVRDVYFRGNSNYLVTTTIPNTHVENVYAEFQDGIENNVDYTNTNTPNAIINTLLYNKEVAQNITIRNATVSNGILYTCTNGEIQPSPVVLENIKAKYVSGSSQFQYLFNVENANILVTNIEIEMEAWVGLNRNGSTADIGKIAFDGFVIKNNVADTNYDWIISTSTNTAKELIDLEIKNFDIECRRGLLGIYNCQRLLLSDGVIRVDHERYVNGTLSGAMPVGLVTTHIGANITIENVSVEVREGITVPYQAQFDNSLNPEQPIRLNIDDSLKNVTVKNGYWTKSPIKLGYGSAVTEIKGLYVTYTLSGYYDVELRYENDGYDIVSPKSMTTAAAKALSSAKTIQTGSSVYDTTLGKPIWWNGTAWVDMSGTTV